LKLAGSDPIGLDPVPFSEEGAEVTEKAACDFAR
jgi:hypothetical protein